MLNSNLAKFVHSLEKQELNDGENVLLFAGRGSANVEFAAGNNCRCNGDNCDCNGTVLKPVEPEKPVETF